MKTPLYCLRHGHVAYMGRIKSPAEKRDRTTVGRAGRLVRAVGYQRPSRWGAMEPFSAYESCGPSVSIGSFPSTCCGTSGAVDGFGRRSRVFAIPRTSSVMPSPEADEIA